MIYSKNRNEKIPEGVNTLSGLGQSIATKNFQQGMQQGMQKGIVETLISLYKDGLLSLKEASLRSGCTQEAFLKLVNEYEPKQ